MTIFEKELKIREIISVVKGENPEGEGGCEGRPSDAFVYVIHGRAEYTFGDRVYTVSAGDLMYLAKGSCYRMKISEEKLLHIHVNFNFEGGFATPLENDVIRHKSLAGLESSFIKMKKNLALGTFADKIECTSLLYHVYSAVAEAKEASYIGNRQRKMLDLAAKEISESFSDPAFSVESLAARLGVSAVHFRRLFYKIYHTSPKKFLTSLKLGRAKELLLETDMPIAKVSEASGFENAYYFSKVIRENTGMTPTALRKSLREVK